MQRVLKNLDHTLRDKVVVPRATRTASGPRAADVTLAGLGAAVGAAHRLAAVAVAAAVLGHLFVSHVVHGHEREEVRGRAIPMMPAFGAMFAVLTAITLSSEAGYLKSAQDGVARSPPRRRGWRGRRRTPASIPAPIHAALERYLVATRTYEWSGDAAATGDDPQTADALADLERAVRSAAADVLRHRDAGAAPSSSPRSTRSPPDAGAGSPTAPASYPRSTSSC